MSSVAGRFTLGLYMLSLFLCPAVFAQDAEWAEDAPITLIVPFAAHGTTDKCARILAPHLARRLQQEVRVVNMPSPTGETGFSALRHARPDGHTALFFVAPHYYSLRLQHPKELGTNEFVPVAGLLSDPVVLAVRADSPFQTLQELIDYARKKPGAVRYGGTGTGSDDYFVKKLLSRYAHTKFAFVELDGSATVLQYLQQGRVDVAAMGLSDALVDLRSGMFRCLGQAGDTRNLLLPRTPTMIEQGYPVIMSSMRGLMLPENTPQYIEKAFSRAVEDVVADKAFQHEIKSALLPLEYSGAREFAARLLLVKVMVDKLWQTDPWAAPVLK